MWRTVGYPVRSRTRQRSRPGIIKINICSSGYFLIPVLNLDLVTAKRTRPTCGSRPFPIGSDLFLPLFLSLSLTDMIINSKQTLCRHQAKQETERQREWGFINHWPMSAHEWAETPKWWQIKSEKSHREETERARTWTMLFQRGTVVL